MRDPLGVDRTDADPEVFVTGVGEVFARFGAETQDSGNVSYGVRVGGRRYFIKTAGRIDDSVPALDHGARVALLRNAVVLAASCAHPALPVLRRVIESPAGPLLVYDWCDGELLGVPSAPRSDPASSHQRFRALPVARIVAGLDVIFELHTELTRAGWVAIDFYDGCLLYDFASSTLHVIDLDMYHRGALRNTRGRMFGSTRFMAPEEHALGAVIDERTTVFNLGRAAFVFLGEADAFRGSPNQRVAATRACATERAERFATVGDFVAAWRGC